MKNLFKYLLLLNITLFAVACRSDKDDLLNEEPNKPAIEFYKNANELAATYDPSNVVTQTVRDRVYDLYKSQKWSELENLFINNNLNGKWPPANGGFNIVDDTPITAGQKYDRYSNGIGTYSGTGAPTLGGSFTSPIINGSAYTFGQRALNQPENSYDFYYEIEVLNNSLNFGGQTADIIPWFNQVGNGKQTMWKIPIDPATGYQKTWNKLAQEGYIKVTIKKNPSGKYPGAVGVVIAK
ncbi:MULTISPECIES: TNT domain-containing protein [unclassified Pedobacter]|uniref:TNT domain-containing protein n=1 Tax=unclassified Pedobacter TaxID=2628915 RepID=UPI00141EBC95|nr:MULTISPECIES: TNT domain-containing protein [unclassified Pedobacter]NII82734.1 hypothetical protein [Pedobacter sp. SG908]NMN36752.1 hypothetical protein [Pedobacter sp. SG918]